VTFRSTAQWHSRFVTAVLCAACIPVLAAPKQPFADAQQAPGRPFTIADEIALAHFGDPNYGKTAPITVSPDRRWVAVHVERGLLSQNFVEDELRVYDMAALREHVLHPNQEQPPVPIWSVRESTYREGALITNIRWLRKSRGLAFLVKTSQGKSQLVFSDLRYDGVTPLSRDGQDVIAFDVHDATHYVYAVRSPVGNTHSGELGDAAVETGRSVMDVLFPEVIENLADRSVLWAADGSSPQVVVNRDDDSPIVLYQEGQIVLALSPDGQTVATALPVSDVPKTWEQLYPAPYPEFAYRIHAGHQDLSANFGHKLTSEYVAIDLHNGKVRSLNGAPTGSAAGWWAGVSMPLAWRDDGKALLLPGTFVNSIQKDHPVNRPCVAVFDVTAGTVECLKLLKAGFTQHGGPEPDYFGITALSFEGQSGDKVIMNFTRHDRSKGTEIFTRTADVWHTSDNQTKVTPTSGTLDVTIKEGLNDPPVMLATDTKTKMSRVIWNPNPQLDGITIDEASVFHWKDATGLTWKGGLFKPSGYVAGRRYPLIIQTHGFEENHFRPSGIFPTAFAARALAAAGIMVLQVDDCPIRTTPQEGPCQVAGYEAAVKELASEQLIDPKRLGIIGFSRTVYYVLEALTLSDLHFKAASVTDGIDAGYWQYLLTVDLNGSVLANEDDEMLGGRPFGAGLGQWLEHSPGFNMQKVHAPLLVVGEGPFSLLSMWQQYATLRYLHRPVDLQMLDTDEHVLTNPAARLASQGGSVDWFRFWLQDYEDPDPDKKEQYKRWGHLRELRDSDAEALDNAKHDKPK
jgi:dipeptidyl aminopeptidase/acylaminoacyl peptidase